ncbi:MAG: serine/threonine protein kinase, partial [Planctomycetaceae bacterium]|nr:serine/threonine protein kinase [Planctomycetaceae bacterium]
MPTKRVIGPFELGERIGVGGMGIVYRAVYTKTGTPVAIKILSPDLSNEVSLQKRFEREISILKKLLHPHIVRYYGGGKIGMQRFYAMELVTGGSLESYLKAKKRLPWEEAVAIGLQVAQALEHAHTAGVIHRDLKPANLMLTKDRKVKLTDFGIARDTTATALTAAGRTVGTYAYMAPEQIRGKPPVDKKTDLYALGCVLFEMLTGETPFCCENQGEML